MRIIAGIAKGRRLVGPKSDRIRPALDQVREAVFNILGPFSGHERVLDLFAGTGSVGLEALSRGAQDAVFVDLGVEALQLIRKNITLCRFEEQSTILRLKVPQQVSKLAKSTPPSFDLIFVDPPYDRDLVNPTLEAIASQKLLAPSGRVVVEHSPRETIHDAIGLFLFDTRKYGQTMISFLRNL